MTVLAHVDDTIAAVSSPAGASPRGVVRLSGPRAIEIAADVFTPAPAGREGFRRHRGAVRWADDAPDAPAELYVFRSPFSYTRQATAEIHTIGSPPVLAGIVEELVRRGARLAEPGEFTARAFLAGALDLTAVEGVAAMIHAGSDAQLRAAEQLLHGALARQTQAIHDRLVDLLSLVEASIDFVEEPIDFLSPRHASDEIRRAVDAMGNLLEQAVPMERFDVHVRVALCGAPNAGKSTLFNRLTGLERSICSPMPGTTRDVIAAPLAIEELSVWMMDTAGIRPPDDAVESDAQAIARRAAATADFVLIVVDATSRVGPPAESPVNNVDASRSLCVINKIDAATPEQVARTRNHVLAWKMPVLHISARTGEGCDDLLAAVVDRVQRRSTDESTSSLTLNARHRAALSAATEACRRAEQLIASHPRIADAAELIALELRDASASLGKIVGDVTTEEMLGRIFGQFCIGK